MQPSKLLTTSSHAPTLFMALYLTATAAVWDAGVFILTNVSGLLLSLSLLLLFISAVSFFARSFLSYSIHSTVFDLFCILCHIAALVVEVAWSLCLSVCNDHEPCETAEPIEMPFWMWAKELAYILDGRPHPHGKGHF